MLCRNAQLQTKRSRGFHPRRCGSPDAITAEQVPGIIAKSRGVIGGQAHSPPSFVSAS